MSFSRIGVLCGESLEVSEPVERRQAGMDRTINLRELWMRNCPPGGLDRFRRRPGTAILEQGAGVMRGRGGKIRRQALRLRRQTSAMRSITPGKSGKTELV